jgi:adenosylcobinamide kinase/adenosylcobinamide-phosphate guanylyltransferase
VIALFLGGASSGKSEVAERFVARFPPAVTYVATWIPSGVADADMAARVAAHQARRPPDWKLMEVGPELPAVLATMPGTVLIDSLGTWVAGCADFAADVFGLENALGTRDGDTVLVSDEVGLGVHPSTALGGRFREALGVVNQAVASVADEVWLVVAGRVLPLDHLQ